MQTVDKMTVKQISDAMLAGLRALRDDGKDLSNNWDVMCLSFPEIIGGDYKYGYGQGGPEDVHATVLRMSRCNSPKVVPSALRKVIDAMKATLERKEFIEDPTIFLSKGNIESYFLYLKWSADNFEKR